MLDGCFQAALRHGYTARNPVRELPASERPRPERKEAAYFENDELPRLFAELPAGIIKTFCLVALKTGMRQGEVVALRWGDVDLRDAVIRVRRSVTGGQESAPKNHECRDVDLTPDLVELLGQWWLSRHLGHSSLKVTTDVYGHWERGERKRQAARLTGAFGV